MKQRMYSLWVMPMAQPQPFALTPLLQRTKAQLSPVVPPPTKTKVGQLYLLSNPTHPHFASSSGGNAVLGPGAHTLRPTPLPKLTEGFTIYARAGGGSSDRSCPSQNRKTALPDPPTAFVYLRAGEGKRTESYLTAKGRFLAVHAASLRNSRSRKTCRKKVPCPYGAQVIVSRYYGS